MTDLHFVVPDTVHRPDRPSGGNTYDRSIGAGLESLGWTVREHAVPGPWPRTDRMACGAPAGMLAAVPDGGLALVDGLVASCVPDLFVSEAQRLRIVVLVHMPLGQVDAEQAGECRVLGAAAAVLTTSVWTRERLLERYALDPHHVHVAEPGADARPLAPGTAAGGELLCVAAVTPTKGHDRLVAALACVADLPWRCVCAGALDLEPTFVEGLRRQARRSRIDRRIDFAGPLPREDLDRAYAAADVLLLGSRSEAYGMVVTEALARGLPVIATAVGGVPEAMGQGPDGGRAGMLVPPGDPRAFAAALRAWLTETEVRRDLRSLARQRRHTLTGWAVTARTVSAVLGQVHRG
ncbi:MAG: glycosyltransferase family 4 protein [Micrococcales bacterium]|nr:glycosyltransferase family 4 protein [Micrococcales bacterium]